MQITVGPETVTVTTTKVFNIEVEFAEPLLAEKIKFKKRLKFVNGKTKSLNFLVSQVFNCMSNLYERRIGRWRMYNVPDQWDFGQPGLTGQAAADKNLLVADRLDKVTTVARKVADLIWTTLGLNKSHSDLLADCLTDCS